MDLHHGKHPNLILPPFPTSVKPANPYPSTPKWDFYHRLKTLTPLPIIIKGIQTVEDAQEAVRQGADGIYLSNHGGRQVDGSPSSLEVALEIHEQAPELFSQIEVFADGGVRYGTDVIKLLALGVKAVGLGRAFMYANVYGGEGVARAIQLLKREVAIDAGNAGIADLGRVDPSFVSFFFLFCSSRDVWCCGVCCKLRCTDLCVVS